MFQALNGLFARHVSTDAFPAPLKANESILSNHELHLANLLVELGQTHLFEKWDPPGTHDAEKHAFFAQVDELNNAYGSGGLAGYIANAKGLLKAAAEGQNPLEGWRPEVPQGVLLEPVTPAYERYETQGLLEVGACGFVLVAGGLGERLGYNGIKVELPTQTITHVSYLELYCRQILTMQGKYAAPGYLVPLAIMVSDDTATKTQELLDKHAYFGLERSQVTLMKQGKVPALTNNNAEIAAASTYVIDAKPHGHGDVHSLMYSTGTASSWRSAGVKWVVFFQDTNGLAFLTLPAMLGVSVELGLDVNSLAIPRVAKQAVGAITKLVHTDGRSMTVNVEYNQLDPLLRATGSAGGDVNDAATGRSPYPGNINQLVFALEPYVATLNRTAGAMPEFVNPKYADAAKMAFKKPTRLECMMQDYPKLLGPEAKVGFTSAPEWVCFSPCKNNSADAAASAASGVPAGSAYTAESDQYYAYAELLRRMGASVPKLPTRAFLGISACPGPCIVLSPESAIFPSDLQCVFPYPDKVDISARSTLVISGDVVVTSLSLDGALQLSAAPGAMLLMKGKGRISNQGHELKALAGDELEAASEVVKMRGYVYVQKEMRDFNAVPNDKGGVIIAASPAKATPPDGGAPVTSPPTSSSSSSFLPSFFSSSETKADGKEPARVDEKDGVIQHLDEYSPVAARDEDIDAESLAAHMRPLTRMGTSVLDIGVTVITMPAVAVTATAEMVLPQPRKPVDPQEYVCDGERLVPIYEYVPDDAEEEKKEVPASASWGFFPPVRGPSVAAIAAEYVPPSATPSKARGAAGGEGAGADPAAAAAAADAKPTGVFSSLSGLLPSFARSSSSSSSNKDDFGQHSPKDAKDPAAAAAAAAAASATVTTPPRGGHGAALEATPTRELDKSISLLSAIGAALPTGQHEPHK